MFQVGDIEAQLTLDRTPFAAGLRAARMEAQRFASERYTTTINVDVDDAAAKARLDRLSADDKTVHGDFDLDIGAAEAKIELLKRQAAGIGGGIGGGVGGGGSGGGSFGPGFLQNPLSFLWNHWMGAAIGTGISFAPTIGASAVQGTLGAGALGLGLGGAGAVGGAGILATAIPAVKGLAGAFEAYSTQQKAAGANAIQSAQQQLQASAAAQQAAEQVSTARTNLARAQVQGDQAVSGAEEQLRNAQQSEELAQKALTQARRDAVRQLQDMRRAAVESVTAEQQAQINLQMARRALAQAPANTSGLELRQLQLNVTEARQALTDAHISRKRANEDANKAERQGAQGMPQVVAAQNALKQAHQGAADAADNLSQAETQARQSVKDAQRQVSDALRAQALQAKEASLQARALAASNDKLGYALSKLPPAGREVFHMLEGIKNQWHELSMPAQNQFFGLLADGIHEADRLLPGFADSADTSMTAARGAFDHFLGIFDTPDFHTFETTMTHTFAAGIGPLERGVENIGHVLERIAVASAPDVLRMLNGFQDVTHGWEQDTRNAASLQRNVHGTVQEFGDWFDLAGSLGHLLAALFITNEQGAKRGGREVEAVSHQLDQWARWIEHHHHDINSFFGQLNDDVGLLLGSAGEIASVVLPAFKPVGDIIHEIVSDLNSLKVGNVSALTVLLGIMAGRGIAGKLGLIGAGAGAAGGIGAGEAAAAGGGGGLGIGALAGRAGAFLLEHPMVGPTAAGAGAAVAFQSLAGKPGTFLGPGIAGLVPDAGDFTHAIRRDLEIQRSFHHKSLSQLQDLRDQAQAQWQRLWETDPEAAQSAGARAMARTAKFTAAQISDQIRAEKIGTAFADSVAEGGPALKRQLHRVGNAFDDMSKAQQDASIKAAKQELDALHNMGLITLKQERQGLSDLEDAQAKSQRHQRQKFDAFGQAMQGLTGKWFGSMVQTVDTLLGNKGITGMVNQLLTGVASQHKLKWNATTVGRTAGTLAGFLGIGGGQRGGMTGGWSSFDDRMVPLRGNEAILRGEDHVPIVSRALQNTYGFGLGDLFARTGGSGTIGSGLARGGRVSLLPGVNMRVGDEPTILNDLRAFAGIEGKTVYVISGYRTPAHSVAVGGFADDPHTQGKAADIGLGSASRDSMFGVGESVLNRVGLYRPFYPPSAAEVNHVQLLHGGAGVTVHGRGGGIGTIPRIVIKGPGGGIHDGLQGIADRSRHAANEYLQSFMAAVGHGGSQALAHMPKTLPPSLQRYNHLWAPHQSPDFGGPTMPFNKIAELAEWAGGGRVPGVTMAQVTKGESGSRPGAWGIDPGGTRGYGLWAITTGVGNDAMINALGGPRAMLNPIVNSQAMAKIYAGSGLGAWYGTGSVTDTNAHYTGPMKHAGGMIPPYSSAQVHPPEILVPGGQHGTGVVSQEDTMRLLRRAAQGHGPRGEAPQIIFDPEFHVHVHAHPGSGADLLQDEITAGIENFMDEMDGLAHAKAGMER